MAPPRGTPLSTYRLQLHKDFTLAHAREVLSYVAELGVTDLYLSPILMSEPGSTHGYNLVDPRRIDPELGGREAWDDLARAIEDKKMGVLLDIVPNHMGIASEENRLWMDVLENGRSSAFASFFDIDWDPPKVGLKDRVLLPILGDPYGLVLERGELNVLRDGGTFVVTYYGRKLPCEPTSIAAILDGAIAALASSSASTPPPAEPGDVTPPRESDDLSELRSIRTAIQHLPPSNEADAERRDERAREKEVVKRRIAALCTASTAAAGAIDSAVATLNGTPTDPKSFDPLDAFLRNQNFRVCAWKVATEEINYRRFFDVNELAAVRMEDPKVFAYAHDLIFDLIKTGPVSGLRLDHTDGLYDPEGYFDALAEHAAVARASAVGESPLYVVAEKILTPGEKLPRAWKIHGTSGYDFLTDVNAVFIDASSEAALTVFRGRFAGVHESLRDLAHSAKEEILRDALASEINVLARALERIAEDDRRSRDFTRHILTNAIVEVIASFPVYRTYVRPDGTRAEADLFVIDQAIRRALRRSPTLSSAVTRFLRDVLAGSWDGGDADARRSFAMKFQQLTGPVTAKGVEDTAFYRDTRLVSLSEVGSAGEKFGITVDEFHRRITARAEAFPLSMTAISTHDTKRGEDVRARIDVLSEATGPWRRAVTGFSRLATAARTTLEDEPAPSLNDEYLFYQSVVGACPYETDDETWSSFTARICEYMAKASREAKVKTSWVNPHEAYESALRTFCETMMGNPRFHDGVRALVDLLAPHATVTSLSQTALRLMVPGVADTFQGCEMWNLSLVDPDNRRPVDYDARRGILASIAEETATRPASVAPTLLERYRDGGVKLFTTHRCLALRRRHRDLFLEGSYTPIAVDDKVIAFTREHKGERIVCVTPRFSYTLSDGQPYFPVGTAWKQGSLTLPNGTYVNIFTGEKTEGGELPLTQVFATFPLAVYERVSS